MGLSRALYEALVRPLEFVHICNCIQWIRGSRVELLAYLHNSCVEKHLGPVLSSWTPHPERARHRSYRGSEYQVLTQHDSSGKRQRA